MATSAHSGRDGGVVGAVPAYALAQVITAQLGEGFAGAAAALLAGGTVLTLVYLLLARRLRVAEVNTLLAMTIGRLRRAT